MVDHAVGYLKPTGFVVGGWMKSSSLSPTDMRCLISTKTQASTNYQDVTGAAEGRQMYLGFSPAGLLHFNAWKESAGTAYFSYVDDGSSGARAELSDGAWHFFAIRLAADKKTFTLWFDEEIVTTQTAATPVDWNPGTLTFGGTYATWLGDTGHDLFTGSFSHLFAINRPVSDARVTEYYNAGSGSGEYFAGDSEVERIDRILKWANVPVSARSYDEPLTTLQGMAPGENAWTSISETAKAALGLAFADGNGRIVYQNRRRPNNRFVRATLSESLGSSVNVGMIFETDPEMVYNDVRGTRPNGIELRLQNKASQDQFGRATYEVSAPIQSDTEFQQMCSYILGRYSVDRTRLESITINAESSDVGQYLAETAQIGDTILLDELTDNCPLTTMRYTIDSIADDLDADARTWLVTFTLTPADLYQVLQVGTSTVNDGSYIAF